MKALPQGTISKAVFLLLTLLGAGGASAYSVLTHEELIDLAWNDSIRPLLIARFPGATDGQLREAHAFAYGGCAIQDMGYYPFGKKFFSNLTHYVRTGDFIAQLLRDARTINELAFAVGALSHYLGDSIGHHQAINPATADGFPKLKAKFGRSVTYGESPHAHIRTEFAFDVGELSDAAFAPPAYLTFVGFEVPRKFLEQAFARTYGFDIHEILGRAHPALRSYRTSVRSFIPSFAEAEVVLHSRQFPPSSDDAEHRLFAQRIARTGYDRMWKHTYRGPGFKAHLLAVLVFIVPKIGAASDLAIKIPTAETEKEYVKSVNHTVDRFHDILHQLADKPGVSVALENLDLDIGETSKLGAYPLADKTYADLLQHLTATPKRAVGGELKQNILRYYKNYADTPGARKELVGQLTTLESMSTK